MHSLAQRSGGQVSCLLTGDFNVTPASPLYRFICEGSFDCDSADRRSLSGQVEQTRAERRRARAAQAALQVGLAQGLGSKGSLFWAQWKSPGQQISWLCRGSGSR